MRKGMLMRSRKSARTMLKRNRVWGFQNFIRKQKINKAAMFNGKPTIISQIMATVKNEVSWPGVDGQCIQVAFFSSVVPFIKSISAMNAG